MAGLAMWGEVPGKEGAAWQEGWRVVMVVACV